MDHVRLYPARLEPARQPEAVAAGFEGNRNPRDSAAGPDRLIPPAMRHGKQPFWAWLQLLARLTLNQPARLAQLDDGNDRAILLQGDEGPAQVVRLGHRGTPSLDAATKLPFPRRPPHSISRSRDRRDLPGSATRAALWRSEGKEKSDHHSVRASQGAIVVKQNQEIAPEARWLVHERSRLFDGANVAIEYRLAAGDFSRLPAM